MLSCKQCSSLALGTDVEEGVLLQDPSKNTPKHVGQNGLFIHPRNEQGNLSKIIQRLSVLRTHVWVKIYKGSTPLQFSNAVDNVLPPLPPSLFLLVVIFFTGHGQAPGGGGSVQHPEAENVSSKYALGGFRPSRQRARVVAKLACFSTYTRDRPLQHPNAAIY